MAPLPQPAEYHPTFEADKYEYKQYLPTFPKIDYEPFKELKMVDRGLNADPEMKALLGAATAIDYITPYIGVQLDGIDLRQLSDTQKDELALLAAQRGCIVFKNQAAGIHELLDIARYFGPLHVHSTTGVPAEPDLNGVHIVWADGTKPVDQITLDRPMNWHSDQTYEINTPGLTSLKVITAPTSGGDTIWASGYAVYSSFSRPFQKYLETLTALHSSDRQKVQAETNGTYIRRPQTDFVHPVVRVHPVTGMKSIYVNPSYTRRIMGVPKAESDNTLALIYSQIFLCQDFQARIRWSKDQVVFWDNRCTWHTATYDYFPEKRHALRATPVAERPMSVAEYEETTGKKAKDWYKERMAGFGIDVDANTKLSRPAGAD